MYGGHWHSFSLLGEFVVLTVRVYRELVCANRPPYWDNYLATMFSVATPTHMGMLNCGDPLPNPPSPFFFSLSLSLCLMQNSRGAVFCLISHPALPQRCGHSSTALRDWKVGVLLLNSIPDIIPSTSICDRVCVCVKWFSYALECVLFCD